MSESDAVLTYDVFINAYQQWRFWDLQFGGQWGHIFSWGVTELYYRSDGSMIWGEGVRQGSVGLRTPEAEAFSLNYTLILDFFEHDI